MDRLIVIIASLGLVWGLFELWNIDSTSETTGSSQSTSSNAQTQSKVFNLRNVGSQSTGAGKVVRILPDDNSGSRHQKFIVEMPSGKTLLIAHNIDLAPRIGSLSVGDTVTFLGVYANNSKGGVIHWTHHDPRGKHPGGWLQKQGRKYQ